MAQPLYWDGDQSACRLRNNYTIIRVKDQRTVPKALNKKKLSSFCIKYKPFELTLSQFSKFYNTNLLIISLDNLNMSKIDTDMRYRILKIVSKMYFSPVTVNMGLNGEGI